MNIFHKMFRKNKPIAFIVDDECGRCKEADVEILKSLDVEVEKFSDFNQLLYRLRASKTHKYKFGVIHQNGKKYPCEVLSDFIKSIDPTIQLIIYKTQSELERDTKNIVLT